jgi:hypothetical protein
MVSFFFLGIFPGKMPKMPQGAQGAQSKRARTRANAALTPWGLGASA